MGFKSGDYIIVTDDAPPQYNITFPGSICLVACDSTTGSVMVERVFPLPHPATYGGDQYNINPRFAKQFVPTKLELELYNIII